MTPVVAMTVEIVNMDYDCPPTKEASLKRSLPCRDDNWLWDDTGCRDDSRNCQSGLRLSFDGGRRKNIDQSDVGMTVGCGMTPVDGMTVEIVSSNYDCQPTE